jgi:hypothetical protein
VARTTPQQAAEKWSRRLAASTPDIQAGVQRLTTSPTQQAAGKQDKYVQGVQEAAQNGKWRAGLERVSLSQWQAATINKGVPRIASGAQAAQPKMQQFMAEFLPYVDQGVAQIQNMPDLTVEDGVQRAAAMIRHNAAFRRR